MAEIPEDVQAKVESLQEQAARCRRLARHTTDREVARKLLDLAEEFEQQAAELGARKRCI